MNTERYAAISEMLVEAATPLAQDTRTGLAAGELIWGGIAHACNAADALANAGIASCVLNDNGLWQLIA